MKLPIILRIFKSGALKEVKQFEQDIIVIGQSADVAIELEGDGVSAIHCLIEKRDTGTYICDMGSQTGTRLNGKSVLDEKLKTGDSIEVEDYKIVFYEGAPKTKTTEEAAAPLKPALVKSAPTHTSIHTSTPVKEVKSVQLEKAAETKSELKTETQKIEIKKIEVKTKHHDFDFDAGKTFAPESQIDDLKTYIKPQKGTLLEVIVGWKNTILGVYHFPDKVNIKGGFLSEQVDVYIPTKEFGGSTTIAQITTTGAQLFVPSSANISLMTSEGEITSDQLESQGRLNKKQVTAQFNLDQSEVLCVEFEDDGIIVLFRYAQKTQTVMLAPPVDLTSGEMTAMALVTIMVGLLGLFVSVYTPKIKDAEKQKEISPIQVAKFIYDKPYTPPPPPQPPAKEEPQKAVPPVIKPPDKIKMSDQQIEKQNKGNPNVNRNQQEQRQATRANEVKPIPGRTSKSKNMTSVYKQGGSVKISDKPSANAQSSPAADSGLFAALNSGGVREKLDQAYSGVGQALGTADKATGAGGPNENRAGSDVGGRFKDTGAGGKGTATQGIAGIGTLGRGDGTSAYGSANGMGGKSSVSVSGGGFEEEFVGTIDKDAVRRVVQEHIREIRSCYERELNKSPGIEGKVIMTWDIGPQGKVLTASTKETSLNNSNVENCMARAIKSWRFPEPPSNQIAEITYPFNLVGKR